MTDDQLQQLLEGLEARLDKRLEANNAKLLEDIDQRIDARLTERLEQNNAALFGQLTRHFDKRFDAQDAKLDVGLNRIYTQLDGISKRLETDGQENTIAEERQNQWIGQLAKATGTRLVPEQ